jgi:hypothetical protein
VCVTIEAQKLEAKSVVSVVSCLRWEEGKNRHETGMGESEIPTDDFANSEFHGCYGFACSFSSPSKAEAEEFL